MILSARLANHRQCNDLAARRDIRQRLFIKSTAAPENSSIDLEAELLKREDAEQDARLDWLAENIERT